MGGRAVTLMGNLLFLHVQFLQAAAVLRCALVETKEDARRASRSCS
jgi:hypothetical protein